MVGDEPEFEIGLVLAGAVSAGAYSAGVIDFMVEALDAYEVARTTKRTPEGEAWAGPTHRVRVPVMAGASAGGMTAAMAAMQMHGAFDHAGPGQRPTSPARNRLYASWVDEIDLDPLLDLDDFKDQGRLKSVLCSTALDAIVARTLAVPPSVTRAWVGRGESQALAVLLTVSNTGGAPYRFRVSGGGANGDYAMLNHGEDLRFVVGRSPKVLDEHGGFTPFDLDAPAAGVAGAFAAAALATGAFPIGLAARPLSRSFADYYRSDRVGAEQVTAAGDLVFVPVTPVPPPPDGQHQFVGVDGGVIDNEPLELARRFLSRQPAQNPKNRNGRETRYAVVLIDPFPNCAAWPADDKADLLSVVAPKLISMLIDQARFKPQELALALDDSVFSRFAILPEPTGATPAAQGLPIACGALGGFSGFLHRSFRHHDYCLGRRNAQAFLSAHFCLPETNPLFDAWKAAGGVAADWHVPDSAAIRPPGTAPLKTVREVVPTEANPDPARVRALPIIPLTPRLRREIVLGPADQPRPDLVKAKASLAALERRLGDRFDAVVAHLVDDEIAAFVPGGWLGRQALKQFLPGVARRKAMASITAALDQISAAFPPPES